MQAPNRLTKHEERVDHVEAPALARLVKHRPAAGLARVDVGAAAQQERCDLQSTERTVALTYSVRDMLALWHEFVLALCTFRSPAESTCTNSYSNSTKVDS